MQYRISTHLSTHITVHHVNLFQAFYRRDRKNYCPKQSSRTVFTKSQTTTVLKPVSVFTNIHISSNKIALCSEGCLDLELFRPWLKTLSEIHVYLTDITLHNVGVKREPVLLCD